MKDYLVSLLLLFFHWSCRPSIAQEDPFSYNGGSMVAMAGKDCVGIAMDRRFGVGPQYVGSDSHRVLKVGSTLIGTTGLETDVQSLLLHAAAHFREMQCAQRASMPTSPSIAAWMSHVLYEKRYICQPIVVGFMDDTTERYRIAAIPSRDGEPYLCAMDGLGAQLETTDFVVSGISSESLYGICENLYRKNWNEEELRNQLALVLQLASQRECKSGNGICVYILSKDGRVQITTYKS